MPNFCERRCLPRAFFSRNMKKPEECLQCHGNWGCWGCQCHRHPPPPRRSLYVVQAGGFGCCSHPLPRPRGPWQAWKKLSRFLQKKKHKWGFCSATELMCRHTHKKTNLHIVLTTCIQRYLKPAQLVQAEGLWVREVDDACRPLNAWTDYLPAIVGPQNHLCPHQHVPRQWPKLHLIHKVIRDLNWTGSIQPE